MIKSPAIGGAKSREECPNRERYLNSRVGHRSWLHKCHCENQTSLCCDGTMQPGVAPFMAEKGNELAVGLGLRKFHMYFKGYSP